LNKNKKYTDEIEQK